VSDEKKNRKDERWKSYNTCVLKEQNYIIFAGIYCRFVSECRIRVILIYLYIIIIYTYSETAQPNMAVIGIIIARQIYINDVSTCTYTRMTYAVSSFSVHPYGHWSLTALLSLPVSIIMTLYSPA